MAGKCGDDRMLSVLDGTADRLCSPADNLHGPCHRAKKVDHAGFFEGALLAPSAQHDAVSTALLFWASAIVCVPRKKGKRTTT